MGDHDGQQHGPGEQAPAASMSDVARSARVSRSTVSNVLNDPDRVAPERRQRVLAAVEALGYVRNEGARSLRSGRSTSLGLIVLDAWNPFFTEFARGVEDVTFGAGWNLLMANSARQGAKQSSYVRSFVEGRVAGVIMTPQAPFEAELATLSRQRIPAVVLDWIDPSSPTAMSVWFDNVAGGRMVGEHLLGLGHRDICFVGDEQSVSQVADRLQGLRDAVQAHPDADRVRLWLTQSSQMSLETGDRIGQQIARAKVRPTAVFAPSDVLAVGVLHGLQRAGVSVPAEVSLVGFDDIPFAAQTLVPLTTVKQPAYEMGRCAAQMLITRVAAPLGAPSQVRVFMPTLVPRESTAVAQRASGEDTDAGFRLSSMGAATLRSG